MAMINRTVKTLRTHWKKSTLGLCLLSYGGHWGYNKYCIYPSMSMKKATVFLNPAACNGKARTLFEKNAAPILNLAGIDITLVKTDYEGQAKNLLELMEETDLIIVAGGDGTLQEVITGLLRRPDQASFGKVFIGFIPLGKNNSLSRTLYPEIDNQVQLISEATLSILKGYTIPLDVLQIKGEKDQPVFAVNGLRWGSYRDASEKDSKYWYLGPLKTRAAHLFSTFKEWPQRHQASLLFIGPTERPPEKPKQKAARPPLHARLYKRLAQYWMPQKVDAPDEVSLQIWQEEQLSAVELSIITQNHELSDAVRTNYRILIKCIFTFFFWALIAPLTKTSNLWDFFYQGSCKYFHRYSCKKKYGTEGYFSIDSEKYEAMSVEVTLLPRKLRFLCHPTVKQSVEDVPS
uniref:Acylglycerol kinase, mitochondrial n=1 Tax=Leptobrachium leishanense TaxID=445787 RepID=A0A8C5PQI0_9ANUR